MRLSRALGNNAALAVDDDGTEVVVLGRGLTFGLRRGDELAQARVEQVFVADPAQRELAAQFLTELPPEAVRAGARVAELAHERLGLRVSQGLILPLADHLAFAAQRSREGIALELPLSWEVAQLYPQELEVARDAIGVAQDVLDVRLDPTEAIAIAMHLVNAQFDRLGTSAATRMTRSIAKVLEILRSTAGLALDKDDMSTARFVTHLRYLFVRLDRGEQMVDTQPGLPEAIAAASPEASRHAERIAYLIGMGTSTSLSREETAYLAMHVARLLHAERARRMARHDG